MKVLLKLSIGLLVGVSVWSCKSDDEALVGSPELTSKVGFSESIVELKESESLTISIVLDNPATRNGHVVVGLNKGTDNKVNFDREISDDKMIVPVLKGQSEIGLTVFPVDNSEVNENLNFILTILSGSNGIEIGSKNLSLLSIIDDEVVNPGEPGNEEPQEPGEPVEFLGMPKSYETFSGSWRFKKTYEYDEEGRLSKVYWETETPMLRTGTDTYYYDANGNVERVNHYENIDDYYYYSNNRLVRSERIENGVMKSYNLYDRDPEGNLGGMISYNIMADGTIVEGLTHIYLYFDNHNVYKHLVYTPNANGPGHILLSTKTYDGYSDNENPFPMVEILPTIKMQPNLPATHKLEENGYTFNYSMRYDYDENGLMISRSVSSNYGGEFTRYEWY